MRQNEFTLITARKYDTNHNKEPRKWTCNTTQLLLCTGDLCGRLGCRTAHHVRLRHGIVCVVLLLVLVLIKVLIVVVMVVMVVVIITWGVSVRSVSPRPTGRSLPFHAPLHRPEASRSFGLERLDRRRVRRHAHGVRPWRRLGHRQRHGALLRRLWDGVWVRRRVLLADTIVAVTARQSDTAAVHKLNTICHQTGKTTTGRTKSGRTKTGRTTTAGRTGGGTQRPEDQRLATRSEFTTVTYCAVAMGFATDSSLLAASAAGGASMNCWPAGAGAR